MKRSLIIIMLIAICSGSQAQIPSSCVIPPLLANEYKRDIAKFDIKPQDAGFVTT